MTYSLLQSPQGMQVNPQTGLMAWTPTPDQSGLQEVWLQVADDGGQQETLFYTIAVGNAAPNLPPEITSVPGFFASVGELYSYDLNAVDPEGTTVTYDLLAAPTGASIDTASGLLQLTPTADQLGTTIVQLVARDAGQAGVIQEYSLTVLPPNQSPQIESDPVLAAIAGGSYRYDVTATDPDGDVLQYHLADAPEGMVIDGLGRIFWTPTADQIGEQAVRVRVSDARNGVTEQSYAIDVRRDEQTPQVAIQLENNPVDVGANVGVLVTAVDNVRVTNLVLTGDGVAIPLDAQGRAILPADTVGLTELEATATDAAGNTGSTIVQLSVIDPSDVEGPQLRLLRQHLTES